MKTNRWIWNNSNTHNNTSYKGGKDGRPVVEQLVAILRRSLTSDDSRTGVQRTKTVQSTTQRLQRLLSFRTSPQGLHNRTSSPTLSCSCFVADSHDHLRVSTDVTQRHRDDNLQVIWRASPRVLCSKLHYLQYRSVQSFTKSQMALNSLSTSTF